MKKHYQFIFPFILLLLVWQPIFSQSREEGKTHEFKHFRVAAAIGHAYIPKAKFENSSGVIIPTFGLELQYWHNPKWGITLKSDLEIATYSVESKNDNTEAELVREYPVIVALPVLFSPWDNNLTFILGPGIEFEEHTNFSVLRIGVGTEVEFGNHWDFAPEIIYDLKNGHINSLTIAIGVGKRF